MNPKKMEDFPIVKNPPEVFDSPSVWVLVRTLFEGYMNMNYLLIDPRSNEEREFRLDRWDRHGLLERQKMACSIGSHDTKLKTDEEQIDKLTKSIRDSKYFKILSPASTPARWAGVSSMGAMTVKIPSFMAISIPKPPKRPLVSTWSSRYISGVR